MNSVVFRKLNKVYIGDTCEHGLGSYVSHGRTCVYTTPERLICRSHIIPFELIIHYISIWICIQKVDFTRRLLTQHGGQYNHCGMTQKN